MPIRINMIRPIPFWPSFEPCAKLTPVQVRINSACTGNGGGVSPLGASYNSGRRIVNFARSRRPPAQQNPMIGEMSKDRPTSSAFTQFTPSPNMLLGVIAALARPTPRIEPIRVWELEAGKPRYQVPRFQIMEDSRRANTMAKPAPLPTLSTSSTGSSATTPKATAPDDDNTPIRFHMPDQTTATLALSDF